MTDQPRYPTALGASSLETITLLGSDLARDVMGTVGFGELSFWLATQRRPMVSLSHPLAGLTTTPTRKNSDSAELATASEKPLTL